MSEDLLAVTVTVTVTVESEETGKIEKCAISIACYKSNRAVHCPFFLP